jgi:lysophospholipase L1-like esterase
VSAFAGFRGTTRAALLALAGTASCLDSGRAPSSGQPIAPPAVSSPDASGPVRYLALGDSFTIGTGGGPADSFPARLAGRWRAKGCTLALENVAVNGYTSGDVIERELPRVASFHPTFVSIAVGANDIVRGASLEAYRDNVRRILDAAKGAGARVVVLPQPDWSRSPSAAGFGTQPALADVIARFNATLAAEARAKGAEWVDLYPLMQQQAIKGQLASDGLHPSSDAYDEWAGELARVLVSPCGS